MNGLNTRLRQKRKELKLTQKQVAKSLGITASSVTQWEQGATKPSGESLYALCKLIECQPDWLLYGKSSEPQADYTITIEYEHIPIYGDAHLAAGNGRVVESESVTDHIPLYKTWIREKGYKTSHLIVFRVEGDSMVPLIKDKDLLLIDTSAKVIESGKIYAISANNELRVKRIHRQLDGSLVISSDNKSPEYQDQTLSKDQLNSLQIIGRVVNSLMVDL